MKVRRSIVAAGAAVVLGTTGALVLPAVASAHDAVHTLKYIAVANKTIAFTSTTFGIQDTDINGTGKIIGFDDVYVTVPGTNTARGNAAIDITGGFLYVTLTTTNGSKTFSGKVTGGPGRSRERPARSPARPSATRRGQSRLFTAKARQPGASARPRSAPEA